MDNKALYAQRVKSFTKRAIKATTKPMQFMAEENDFWHKHSDHFEFINECSQDDHLREMIDFYRSFAKVKTADVLKDQWEKIQSSKKPDPDKLSQLKVEMALDHWFATTLTMYYEESNYPLGVSGQAREAAWFYQWFVQSSAYWKPALVDLKQNLAQTLDSLNENETFRLDRMKAVHGLMFLSWAHTKGYLVGH